MNNPKEYSPILFAYKSYGYIANELIKQPGMIKGEFSLKRFPNDELYVSLGTQVKNQSCVVMGSISPPETNLFSFLLLCHTLKKENASEVIALVPYLAYSRHDKNEAGKSYTLALIGGLLSQAGIDKLITFDIHNTAVTKIIPIQIESIFPAELFADVIKAKAMHDYTIVSPDEGAIERCRMVADKSGITRKISYMKKHRTEEGITHGEFHGDISERVIIIDDMIDTGGTLISCCEYLNRAGVKDICIMVTHGLFTGKNWEKLWELGVKNIYCTNTLPMQALDARIIVLSIVPILQIYFS